jgi:DNA-binding MarR family transcriptional regulator
MDSDKFNLIEYTLNLVEQLYHLVGPVLPKEWLSLDLTMPEVRVLLLLFTDGSCHMSALATASGVPLSTATNTVDRLVEKELVARSTNPEDRRVVICNLTPGGQELANKLWELGRLQIQGLLELLSQDQLEVVANAVEFLYEAAESEMKVDRHIDHGAGSDL